MIVSGIFAMVLIGLSGLLIDSHRRAWLRVQQVADLGAAAERFARLQYRRRMQASSTIGVLGAAIAIGPLVPRQLMPMTAYLGVLLSGAAWILLLAMFDAWATRSYYRRLRNEHVAAEVKLARELEAAQHGVHRLS